MIFVDTVAWLYLFDSSQNQQESRKAKRFVRNLDEVLCTSDLVLAETYKWLIHHGRPANQSQKILKSLASQELALILSVEQSDRYLALDLLLKYKDQKLSYEDAITVALATRFSVSKIFSFDKHFLLFPMLQRVPE